MSLSCVPCAKRKVRCDRAKPCSHCRRRREDVCEYPPTIDTLRSTPRKISPEKTQSERIERLEQYIRSLGRDPNQIAPGVISKPATTNEPLIPNDVFTGDNSMPNQKLKYQRDNSSFGAKVHPRHSEQARLVEHDEQTTYLEAFATPLTSVLNEN